MTGIIYEGIVGIGASYEPNSVNKVVFLTVYVLCILCRTNIIFQCY